MTAASWALQKAVYAALTADPALVALCGGRVFDAVPKNAAIPYVVIGEAEERDGGSVIRHALALHLWSRAGGAREIKQIANAVRACLDNAHLTLDGHALIALAFVSADYVRQSDGETWRGSIRFRAVTEPQ
jgi:hypothetical protein